MVVIGLTGGIGTGKSEVARVLAGLGAAWISVDELGHQAYRPHTVTWRQVVEAFGKRILSPGGKINRQVLGAIVFSDPAALDKLNRIMFPTLFELATTEIARREAEERRIAKSRAAAKRKKARYDALVASANADLAVAQDFIAAHPGTPGLLDIVTYMAGTKAALKEGNGGRVKSALGSLRATLSKEKGFSTFLALKEKKRKKRLVAERRRAEEKRKQEIAEAKRQKEEKKRRRAAQVKILKEDLKSYAGFLKRQITQLVKSSPETAQALVPVIKSLEGGLASNDLSVLKALRGRASAAIKKHGLSGQYAQVQKLLKMARKAKREKAVAAERQAKKTALAAKIVLAERACF